MIVATTRTTKDESGTLRRRDSTKKKNKTDENEKSGKSNSSSGKMLPSLREVSENDLLDASEDVKKDYKLKAMALNLVILTAALVCSWRALLASGRYVTAPVVIYVLVKIALTAVYKKAFCRGVSTRSFMVAASKASFLAGALIIGRGSFGSSRWETIGTKRNILFQTACLSAIRPPRMGPIPGASACI